TASVFAQIRGNEIRVVVSPNHADWTYRLKEKCTFTIQVYKAQNLLPDVKVDYELGPEWYPTEKKSEVLPKDGKLTVQGSMNTPGFLRCKVKAYVGGKTYDGMATAAYAPEKIQPHAVNPDDFDSFWEKTLNEARKVALEPKIELLPTRCTEKVNVYQVSFQNIRWGSRTFGILCLPKEPGKYPALLRVPGAGVRPYYGDVETAAKGAITLEIGIHGIPVTMEQSFYDALAQGALYNYQYQNYDNRDNDYYKRVFAGAVRAVDFIASLPQYDGKTLGVTGSSQGGALSMVTAALDKRVTFYAAVHPAMCDHRAHCEQVAGGWPHYFRYFPNATAGQLQTADYYDMVNFARRITVPGWFSWGYNDDVCPPTSTYAAYNSIHAPKELHPYLETGHYWYQEQYEQWNQWIWAQMGL
ncbi:MAG: acetylxylan esterase, partial [Bacteroidales bacterium]|nr:acetylxylan esterase [Bacteroidales bacterium]